jgi:hypothetical protein
MSHAPWLPTLALSLTTALLVPACLSDDGDPASAGAPADTAIRMLPLPFADATAPTAHATPPPPHLTNFGGPIIVHVNVHPVFWNSTTAFQANLNAFYRAIPNSTYFDLLNEYGVLRGSGTSGFVDGRTATTVTDAAIQTELNRLFAAGSLPLPNASTYYPVHFPPGVTITAPDGSRSCVVFCAYHGTYVRSGVNVNYGVIPDMGGGCASACGSDPSRVNNLDGIASAELVDTVTDPAVGLATGIGPPLGWYDPSGGEIVDLCGGAHTTVVGGDGLTYVVDKLFSNRLARCVPP